MSRSDGVDVTISMIEGSVIPASTNFYTEIDIVEESIEIMENCSGLCVHPLHYHSFQSQNGIQTILSNSSDTIRRYYDNAAKSPDTIVSSKNNNICILCSEEFITLSSRIVPQIFQRTPTVSAASKKKRNEPILKCLACHALAHRSCATSTTPVRHYQYSSMDDKTTRSTKSPLQQVKNCYDIHQQCTVNRRKIFKSSVDTNHNNTGSDNNATISSNKDQTDDSDPSTVYKGYNPIETVARQVRRLSESPRNQKLDAAATTANSKVETTTKKSLDSATDPQNMDNMETSTNLSGYRIGNQNNVFPSVPQQVSMTTVAGGIVGGLAGLALLGPVGAVYAGCLGAGGVNAFMKIEPTTTTVEHTSSNHTTSSPEKDENDDTTVAIPTDTSAGSNHQQPIKALAPQVTCTTDSHNNVIVQQQQPHTHTPHVSANTTEVEGTKCATSSNDAGMVSSRSTFTTSDILSTATSNITSIETTPVVLVPSTSTTTDNSTEITAPVVTTETTITTLSNGAVEACSDQNIVAVPVMGTPQKGSGHLKAKELLNSVKQNVSMTAVAGGIAGGLAGMALIGPAGAVYACYLGAGGINVLLGLEGAATMSLVAAGIATGTITGTKLHDHIDETKQRIITMSDPYRRTVLLVRPNVVIDPIWDQICLEAVKSAPKSAYNQRQRRANNQTKDADIINTNEDEMDTNDKILLLVSRVLNDRTSLPGYVLRYLIESYNDRCRNRTILCAAKSQSIVVPNPRIRRDDAHAIIKHVTATLLNVRPELGSSATCTELTASAVESIVFGQIYDSVFEEIITETLSDDTELWRKITMLRNDHPELLERHCQESEVNDHSTHQGNSAYSMPLACTLAMDTLKMVHEARSVSEKLHFCVKFIEALSSHFTRINTKTTDAVDTSNNYICADTLIQMVCQHIILVENYGNLYAQIRFLEDFASDEQLVHGYDGYALVTIQAALRILQQPCPEGIDARDWYKELFG